MNYIDYMTNNYMTNDTVTAEISMEVASLDQAESLRNAVRNWAVSHGYYIEADGLSAYYVPPEYDFRSEIKKVIFNKPATIIMWKDGTKTVVKAQDGDEYNEMVGFAMAVCKKFFGNKGNYYEVFKRWTGDK